MFQLLFYIHPSIFSIERKEWPGYNPNPVLYLHVKTFIRRADTNVGIFIRRADTNVGIFCWEEGEEILYHSYQWLLAIFRLSNKVFYTVQ